MSNIIHNAAASLYEQSIDGHTVFARYQWQGNALAILHVEAPPVLRGKGAAGAFMQALMEQLRHEGVKKVVPVCGYAAAWLTRHKEFSDLL